jgi:hypothetical protein
LDSLATSVLSRCTSAKRSATAGGAVRPPAGGANELAGGARTLASSAWINSRMPAGGAARAGGASPKPAAGGANELAGGARTLASSAWINSRMPAGGAARAGGSPKLAAGGANELAGGARALASSRRINVCKRTSPIVATYVTSFLFWDGEKPSGGTNSAGEGTLCKGRRDLLRFFFFGSPTQRLRTMRFWCTRRGSNPHLPISKTGPFILVLESGSPKPAASQYRALGATEDSRTLLQPHSSRTFCQLSYWCIGLILTPDSRPLQEVFDCVSQVSVRISCILSHQCSSLTQGLSGYFVRQELLLRKPPEWCVC